MAKSDHKDYNEELEEYAGYVSAGEYDERYGDEGPDRDMSSVIVVDGLPEVPESKFQKLYEYVLKIYSAIGKVVEGGLYMPTNPTTKQTEKFAFIEFASAADAEAAITSTNNWDFDKSHNLKVNRYVDFAVYTKEPDTFSPPIPPKFTPQPDVYYFLEDEACRDQFAIRWNNPTTKGEDANTEVLWAETKGPPSLDYAGERAREAGKYWTELPVAWSPNGTYLTTFHPRGAVFWGGRQFQECRRILHPGVNDIGFSPDEKFVYSWNGHNGNEHPEHALVVWDFRTGQELRSFKQLHKEDEKPEFYWSPDSKYLARLGADPNTGGELVQIYETPGITLLDSRSIKASGAQDLSWCPKRYNLLAWWSPEKENAPTSVSIVRIPSREIVRQRNLFNVESCQLKWHPDGVYLCVLAAKSRKTKKGKGDKGGGGGAQEKKGVAGYTVELFRLKDKNIPVEVLDFKDRVLDFQWEPSGNRFGLVSGEGPLKFNVAIYVMADKGVQSLFTLEDKPTNSLCWSPRGEFLVLAGMHNLGGVLEFYDVERKKSFGISEHMQCGGVAWDPSGRLVCTYKMQPLTREPSIRETVDNGYILWTFQGQKVFEGPKPKLYQFLWRPRPEGLLSDEEYKEVAKNLKKYIAKYQDEDKRLEERKLILERLRKRKARDDFRALVEARHRDWLSDRPKRIQMGIEEPPKEDGTSMDTILEEVYEVVLEERVEPAE